MSLSSDRHPKIQAFLGSLTAVTRALDERFPRLTPPAPRPVAVAAEEEDDDAPLSAAYASGGDEASDAPLSDDGRTHRS